LPKISLSPQQATEYSPRNFSLSATSNFSLSKSTTASCGVLNPDLEMNIFFEGLKCKREGDLRMFYGKISIVKYLNAFLNNAFSGNDSPLKVYDEIFKRGIEDFELSEEKAEEFLRYGKHIEKDISFLPFSCLFLSSKGVNMVN